MGGLGAGEGSGVMTGQCKTCRWWDHADEGRCRSPLLAEWALCQGDPRPVTHSHQAIVAAEPSGGWLYTGPDFGCVNHEESE